MSFFNIKLSTRLAFGFGSVILLLLCTTAISISKLSNVNASTEFIVGHRYPVIRTAFKVEGDINSIALSLHNAMLIDDISDIKHEIDNIEKTRARITQNLEWVGSMLTTEKGKELYKGIVDARASYRVSQDAFIEALRHGSKQEAAALMKNELQKRQMAYLEKVNSLVSLGDRLLDKAGTESRESFENSRRLIIGVAVVAMLLASFLAWVIARSIKLPLEEAIRIARTVAAGDLTSRIVAKGNNETGQLMTALRDMNDSLVTIVAQVRQGSDAIARESAEIASGNMDLSQRTEQQASSLEETASSMEELTSTVKQNADNARQANGLAVAASEVAERGGAVVSQVVATMNDINVASRRIADIIGVIDGIAFQTNILALNAAVEAARAGEQGRGFAVVASEVRSLAQRSASAAQEIKALIGDSVEKVDTGSLLVQQAGLTIDEMVQSVRRLTGIMAEISTASNEQSAGIEQINVAITQMDQVTQQNAALVEQARASTGTLQERATLLANVVDSFRLVESRHSTANPHPVNVPI